MKKYKDLKIKVKLIIGFVLVAIIAGIVGLAGISFTKSIDNADTELYEENTKGINYIAKIGNEFQQIRVNIAEIVIDNSKSEEFVEKANTSINNIEKYLESYEKSCLSSDEEKQVFTELKDAWAEFKNEVTTVIGYFEKQEYDSGKTLFMGKMGETANALQKAVDKSDELNLKEAENKSLENDQLADDAFLIMVVIIILAMIVAIILGIVIARIISIPINKMVVVAEKIAQGDLDTEIKIESKDEVGTLARAMEKMVENTNDVIRSISLAAEQVAAGSKQVSDSSIALSQGATEQASSIEQLTSSLEEISSQTKMNADNATKANEIAKSAEHNATQGNARMKEMQNAMEEINLSSTNISKIIKVIDDIAFQTNILALNAAVEAARAGQHGKGFAVVAEEVRNLAARSANAAKETTDLIEGSIEKVTEGTKIANETAEALNVIVSDIGKVASLVSDITVASNEQATGISQVNQGIIQVSQVVQANSATAEESASASEELSTQAERLRESVSRFHLKSENGLGNSYSELSPEIIKMLEDMKEKNAKEYNKQHDNVDNAPKAKIILNDSEFGKY